MYIFRQLKFKKVDELNTFLYIIFTGRQLKLLITAKPFKNGHNFDNEISEYISGIS